MAEGYKPTAGMKAAARKAIKFKEDGKAKGAGTAVGWTRARQLVNGETLSLSTVKRMYSFFSRHEVDKKGKDWGNQSNPSNGYIMWLAWGGDAGYSWSRKIVNREKNMKKSIITEDLVEEIKGILEDVINPVDTVIELEDDENLEKAYEGCKCKECKKMNISCEDCEECEEEEEEEGEEEGEDDEEEMSKKYESDNEEEDKWDNIAKACWKGYTQRGMKEKNGRMVPNCVPVEKVEKASSPWGGMLDPKVFRKYGR